MELTPRIPLARWRLYLVAPVISGMLLSGCVAPGLNVQSDPQPASSARPGTDQGADPQESTVKTTDSAKSSAGDRGAKDQPRVETATELTSELLYDVLVASIAGQRRQPEIALEALSRAVYTSRDKRLNANAIQLALQLKDNQKAIELSRLMLQRDPDNFRVILALASAQIASDRLDDAAETLVDLALKQEQGDEPVLQEIAGLIARQDDDVRDQLVEILDAAAEKDEPMLVFTSSLLASRMDKTEKFRKLLERTLSLEPGWETAAILKLTDAADQDKELMRDWADTFLKDHPKSERFRIQLARLLIQEELLEEALKELKVVLKHDPDSTDGLFTAALVNMDLKNFADAEQQFLNYIEESGNGDQARLYLAQIYVEEERYVDASPLLRQIQSSRYYLDAQITLSHVIAKQSNVDAGLSYLRNITARNEEESVRLILEQDSLLRDFDQQERSLRLLDDALEVRPDQPDLLYSRGLLAAQLDLIHIVEQDLKKLIELQPDNAHAYNALGYTLADQTDRYDEALELIAKALEFLPDDAFILDSMGWVQYRIGNHDQALDYLKRAIKLREDAEIAAHLGEVLWITGNRTEAEDIWRQGKKWSPENTTLLETIDRFLGDSGDKRAVFILPTSQVVAA